MIDLSLPDFDVVAKVPIETPTMAVMHPNGKQLVVGCSTGFKVFEVSASGLVLKKDNELDSVPESFDINPKGDRIVAAHHKSPKTPNSGVRVYSFKEGTISLQHEVSTRDARWKFDDPFSLRFSPDGKRVLTPNGAGLSSKGRLDDIFSIDMTLASPQVTEVIPQVADGMESLAFHPKGHMAVIACLDDCPGDAIAGFSHLAVVDLTSKPAQILYHIRTDSYPEGIEFSPDGSQLFVQQTAANQISVYNVDGFTLKPSPFVLRVGHGPSSMGIAKAFQR
jgi:DNA-binding beta-propeller fold protein YncE